MKSESVKDNGYIRIDLHCHSSYSDGIMTPSLLAQKLKDKGVIFASLTDHDTLQGIDAFRNECARHGISVITGIELTTEFDGRMPHLLAYGFDAENPEIRQILDKGSYTHDNAVLDQTKRYPSSADAIGAIHRAGGIAILAHPSKTEPDAAALEKLVDELIRFELDGIEAVYADDDTDTQKRLITLVKSRKIVTSAGTDCHVPGYLCPGINISVELWKEFRDRLLEADKNAQKTPEPLPLALVSDRRSKLKSFLLNIVMPASLTFILFIISLFAIFLPYFERTLLDRKRDTIREVTQAAWSLLEELNTESSQGLLSLEQAKEQAKRRIQDIRYGDENKDYFWLQDLTPSIIMHPYRKDLNGQDVSEFKDQRGVRIFVEFAELASKEGEGYISYVWQWQDDEERIEPKESYIRMFEPWNWVIGTGIYVYDVQAEIAKLRSYIVNVSLVIASFVLLLLLYLIRQGLRLERSRSEAVRMLNESTERYRSLTEAATEGAMFVSDGRCRYANLVMEELTGCPASYLELLDYDDLFPLMDANSQWRACIDDPENCETPVSMTGVLKRLDGGLLSCVMTLRKVTETSVAGYMILVRRNVEMTDNTGVKMAIGRLLQIPANVTSDIADKIKDSAQVADIISHCRKTPQLVRSLLENGASTTAITHMLATVTDVTTKRLTQIAIREMGPPPVPFCFLALGSQGRESQTLYTDQDNAIVFDSTNGDDEAAQEYFLRLAGFVCDSLEEAGYRNCVGKSMANNPRWCQPLHVWKKYFDEWIKQPEQKQMMEFSIFFDFRPVYGDQALSHGLREHIFELLRETPYFFPQAAQNALQFKAPPRFLGTLMTGGKEHQGMLNVKEATMALVSYARLYALWKSVSDTNTLDRLEAITRLGVLLNSRRDDIINVYEALLRLRLRNQVKAIENNRQPDNWIDTVLLGNIDEVVLRECLREIDLMQNQIRRDFLGG